MDYREYLPWPALCPFVAVIWTLTGDASDLTDQLQPVFPDGQPELILHFGDSFERVHGDRRAEQQPMLLFAGQLNGQLTLRPRGRISVLGVRFRPFGAAALLRLPQHEIVGLTIAVHDLRADLSGDLERIRSATDDVCKAVGLVQHVLQAHMDGSRVDPHVRVAVDAIVRTRGTASIERIARLAGVTRRHLERGFLDAVGVSPKRLACITRFQRALHVLEQTEARRKGTSTAAECGYSDQSHFIREFRQLAGCSPSQYLLKNAELTGFFAFGSVGGITER